MKALVLKGNKNIKYDEVAFPEENDLDNKIVVKIISSGICGSDIGRAFEGKAYHYPLIMGHEFAGEVIKHFSGSKFKRGDRVAVFPLIPCKKCYACQTAEYAQCTNYDYLGSRRDGGFAEYVTVPEENLFLIPDHVNTIHAAMTEPAAVALHAVRKLSIQAGAFAVVYGCGPIGNMTAQWLKIHGCRNIIVVDIDKDKLRIAKDMGFITINSSETDPVEKIHEFTNMKGADIVVEAVGLPITCLNSILSAGRDSQVIFMGNIHGEFKIKEADFSSILRKELKIFGTWNSKIAPPGIDDWSTTLQFMDKELIVKPLISHLVPLEEGEKIFNSVFNKEAPFNKVIFNIQNI